LVPQQFGVEPVLNPHRGKPRFDHLARGPEFRAYLNYYKGQIVGMVGIKFPGWETTGRQTLQEQFDAWLGAGVQTPRSEGLLTLPARHGLIPRK